MRLGITTNPGGTEASREEERRAARGTSPRGDVGIVGRRGAPQNSTPYILALFAVDRREPFTQEPVGAPIEVISSPLQLEMVLCGV
jgi:hypothetical protein